MPRHLLPLILFAALFITGCAHSDRTTAQLPQDEVDPQTIQILVISDARYIMNIEGTRVWTETSSEIQKAQLAIIMGDPAEIPRITHIYRTTSPETPYILQINSERVPAHPPGWRAYTRN
jgi:hypothetical protein